MKITDVTLNNKISNASWFKISFNPLTTMIDEHLFSPYNVTSESSSEVIVGLTSRTKIRKVIHVDVGCRHVRG